MEVGPIYLEDDYEPSWEDAKTRLRVAAETFQFPFYIFLDETAQVYKSLQHYAGVMGEPVVVHRIYFNMEAREANDWQEALRILYPWFHEGHAMPEARFENDEDDDLMGLHHGNNN